jgi:type VI secretion system protein ImpM
MPVFGYFGKIPVSRDFVFQGLSMRTTDVWAEHLSGWLATGRARAGSDWTARFLASPVWRFILPGGVIGESGWAGLIAGSADSVGREFPLTVMISGDFGKGGAHAISAFEPVLDRVEGCLLDFMEGNASRPDFMRILGAVADELSAINAKLANDPGPGLPQQDEEAVCFQGNGSGGVSGAFAWPAASSGQAHSPLCRWWHEEATGRPSELCVTRGLPPRAGAAAFFLGGWEACGWHRRDIGTRRQSGGQKRV